MEVAGDDAPKKVAIRLLAALGWEPLDCGGVADARLLERQGPQQMKHPRQAEDDGDFAKWYVDCVFFFQLFIFLTSLIYLSVVFPVFHPFLVLFMFALSTLCRFPDGDRTKYPVELAEQYR